VFWIYRAWPSLCFTSRVGYYWLRYQRSAWVPSYPDSSSIVVVVVLGASVRIGSLVLKSDS
jgi:hypothetical protein